MVDNVLFRVVGGTSIPEGDEQGALFDEDVMMMVGGGGGGGRKEEEGVALLGKTTTRSDYQMEDEEDEEARHKVEEDVEMGRGGPGVGRSRRAEMSRRTPTAPQNDGTSSCARRLFPTEPGQKKVKKKQSSQPQQEYHYYDEDALAAHGTGVATWEYQC